MYLQPGGTDWIPKSDGTDNTVSCTQHCKKAQQTQPRNQSHPLNLQSSNRSPLTQFGLVLRRDGQTLLCPTFPRSPAPVAVLGLPFPLPLKNVVTSSAVCPKHSSNTARWRVPGVYLPLLSPQGGQTPFRRLCHRERGSCVSPSKLLLKRSVNVSGLSASYAGFLSTRATTRSLKLPVASTKTRRWERSLPCPLAVAEESLDTAFNPLSTASRRAIHYDPLWLHSALEAECAADRNRTGSVTPSAYA